LNRLPVTPPKASYLINLLDEIDKYVPDVQVQLFRLHGVDRIPHRVVLILHNEVLILHNAVLILHAVIEMRVCYGRAELIEQSS
jgi:hypothetical protein